MKRLITVSLTLIAVGYLGAASAVAGKVTLLRPTVSNRKLSFTRHGRQRPGAESSCRGQGQLQQRGPGRDRSPVQGYEAAVLFGGDITAYVVWAVSKDGYAVNLGELATRDARHVALSNRVEELRHSRHRRAYYLVRKPSEMVMFFNAKPASKRIPSDDFPSRARAGGGSPARQHRQRRLGQRRAPRADPGRKSL